MSFDLVVYGGSDDLIEFELAGKYEEVGAYSGNADAINARFVVVADGADAFSIAAVYWLSWSFAVGRCAGDGDEPVHTQEAKPGLPGAWVVSRGWGGHSERVLFTPPRGVRTLSVVRIEEGERGREARTVVLKAELIGGVE